MYAYISGVVDEVATDRAVIEAAGVGYELNCSAKTLRRLVAGQPARLYTHLHLAEGVMALYGFIDTEERDMFRRLLSVTRVGPKLALSVLSTLSVQDVRSAILTNSAAAFDRVPGMGRKTAARVLLELKGNAGDAVLAAAQQSGASDDLRSEATLALVQLGYDGLSAARAVAAAGDARDVEGLIKAALRSLAK